MCLHNNSNFQSNRNRPLRSEVKYCLWMLGLIYFRNFTFSVHNLDIMLKMLQKELQIFIFEKKGCDYYGRDIKKGTIWYTIIHQLQNLKKLKFVKHFKKQEISNLSQS